jgi:hypothetical protein
MCTSNSFLLGNSGCALLLTIHPVELACQCLFVYNFLTIHPVELAYQCLFVYYFLTIHPVELTCHHSDTIAADNEIMELHCNFALQGVTIDPAPTSAP